MDTNHVLYQAVLHCRDKEFLEQFFKNSVIINNACLSSKKESMRSFLLQQFYDRIPKECFSCTCRNIALLETLFCNREQFPVVFGKNTLQWHLLKCWFTGNELVIVFTSPMKRIRYHEDSLKEYLGALVKYSPTLHSFRLQRITEVTSDSTLNLVVSGVPSVLYLANRAINGVLRSGCSVCPAALLPAVFCSESTMQKPLSVAKDCCILSCQVKDDLLHLQCTCVESTSEFLYLLRINSESIHSICFES